MSHDTTTRHCAWLPGVVYLMLAGAGCASIHESLREDIAAGRYHEVVRDGQQWISEHMLEQEDRRQVPVIWGLVAQASLELARKQDTVQAYRAFRARFDVQQKGAERQLEAAFELEARAQFRDATQPAGTLEAFREFRAAYGATEQGAEARVYEVHMAQDLVLAQDQLAGLRSFLEEYGQWTEAETLLPAVTERALEIAFAAARADGTPSAHRAFRDTYGGWDGAAPLVSKSRELEVQSALASVRARAHVKGLRSFQSRYGDWEEAAAAIEEVRELEVKTALADARGAATPDALRAFRTRYADWPEAQELLRPAWLLESELALAALAGSKDYRKFRAFVAAYPGAPAVAAAERRADDLWGFFGPAGPTELKAAVTSMDLRKRGQARLYVQVSDGDGGAVGGLGEQHFRIYTDQGQVAVTGFGGNEQQRPVDVVFLLDTTGSMADSIEGTKRGAVSFAERLLLGNRDLRLGLVTFGDMVRARYPTRGKLTADVDVFRSWVAAQSADGGGDGPENPLDAMKVAASFSFRPQAQVVFVLITDAPAHEGNAVTRSTFAEVGKQLRARGVTLFAMAPRIKDYVGLATFLGGETLQPDRYESFDAMLEHISMLTAKQYLLTCQIDGVSPDRPPKLRIRAERDHLFVAWGRLPSERITHVAAHPEDKKIIAAATADAGVWFSDDGGKRWKKLQQGYPGGAARWLAFVGGPSWRLATLTEQGAVLVLGEDAAWRRPESLADVTVTRLVVVPDDPSQVFATDGQRLFMSVDGGLTWGAIPRPARAGRVAGLTVDPIGAGGLWVTLEGDVVFLTADRGESWRPLDVVTPAAGTALADYRIVRRREWKGVTMAVGPTGVLWRSTDDGAHWTDVTPVPPGARAGDRPVASSVTHARTPEGDGWMVTETSHGVFVSSDHGRSWRLLSGTHDGAGKGRSLVTSTADGALVMVDGDKGTTYRLRAVEDREFVAGSIYFASGSAEIERRLHPHLDELARHLRSHRGAEVHVSGHTDDLGGEDYNLALSLRRAESVRAYLVRSGIAGGRVHVSGEGETSPLFPNSNARNRARNRRVELSTVGGAS